MSFKPVQFTYEEVRVIENRFNMSMVVLINSGDYPEEHRDNLIKAKLLDWLYASKEDINVATRGPIV